MIAPGATEPCSRSGSSVTPARRRGTAIGYVELINNVGILLGFALGAQLAPTRNWRLMVGLGVLPALLVLCLSPCPPCPRNSPQRSAIEDGRKSV